MINIREILNLHEGGYSNITQDKGGETYAGISRRFWPHWEGWAIIDEAKSDQLFPRNLSSNIRLQELKEKFYLDNFYYKYKLEKFQDSLSEELFEQLINRNQVSVIKDVQTVANSLNYNNGKAFFADLIVDGILGNKTIEALRSLEASIVIKCLNAMQACHYIKTAAGEPSQRIFTRGWLTRT